MIYVARTAQPPYLKSREAKWIVELRAARRKGDKVEFERLQGRYGHAHIKKALEEMFSGKCAYCESVIGIVATAHIDHFRPKKRYMSLTYSWNNFLLGCPRCNEKGHKGSKFPSRIQGGPFVDPSTEDPTLHLDFEYDGVAGLAMVRALTPRGKLMIDTFGLNSRPELIRSRTFLVKTLLALKPNEATDPEIAALLADARGKHYPYQAWVRKYKL